MGRKEIRKAETMDIAPKERPTRAIKFEGEDQEVEGAEEDFGDYKVRRTTNPDARISEHHVNQHEDAEGREEEIAEKAAKYTAGISDAPEPDSEPASSEPLSNKREGFDRSSIKFDTSLDKDESNIG